MTSFSIPSSASLPNPLPDTLETNWLLMLDVDGTLLDIAHRPDRVSVPLTLKETLLRLHDLLGGALVLVSGRPIADLETLFEPLKLPMIGLHGGEKRVVGDRLRREGLPSAAALARLTEQCRQLMSEIPGLVVEAKPASVAVHYRLNAMAESAVRRQTDAFAKEAGPDWMVLHGKAVCEIKPVAFSKGHAVRELCAMRRFEARKPVYIGDDVTDESAFEVMDELEGMSIKVTPHPLPSRATIESPMQLRRWLAQLALSGNGHFQTQPLFKPSKSRSAISVKRRMIILSNRVALPRAAKANAGGLAVAMSSILNEHGGVWLGWSGKAAAAPSVQTQEHGAVTYMLQDLTPQEYEEFYTQFCNAILWPLLHYHIGQNENVRHSYDTYCRVNERYADLIQSILKPDDLIWVHDFHFFPLADALRRRGVKNRIGFFLHIPFPSREVLITLPVHKELMGTLGAYDVVGFQTKRDLEAFCDYAAAENLPLGATESYPETFAGHFPISIDTQLFANQSRRSVEGQEAKDLKASLEGRALILGVDRMDYSKGLVQRMKAIDELLTQKPEFRKKFTFLQIAPPTREDVQKYADLRAEVEALVGHINGKHAMVDWVPIRFLARGIKRETIAAFYRLARVCLVTPLRDGMNLVAKEYVAAQAPEDPGALILSHFAGASEEFHRALLVNPYDTEEMAGAIAQALSMPKRERQERWRDMYNILSKQTLEKWYQDYLDALAGTH